MFVIGKSKKTRCFKNVKQLPCRYRMQKKSWMTGVSFEEWVRKLDSSCRAQSRKVPLLIGNSLFTRKSRTSWTSTWFSCLQIQRLFFNVWIRVYYEASNPITERKSFVFVSKPWRATNRFQRLVYSKQWNTWYHGMPYQSKPLLTVSRNLT